LYRHYDRSKKVSIKTFIISLFLPSQAAADTEATITKWNVANGDSFEKGQILAEIESAKTSFDFEAPCSGKVVKLSCLAGDTVSYEVPVMEIETTDESMLSDIPVAGSQPVTVPGCGAAPVFKPEPDDPSLSGDRQVSILGFGGYLPERIVTNRELLKEFPSVTEDYIFGVTGIRERRWAHDDEKPSDMAINAALEAIRKSGMEPKDIGGIVVATETPDMLMPSTACVLQDMLGIRGIPAFDLHAACSGWLYGIGMARGMILSNLADNILVVSTERQSQLLDQADLGTYFLFGDGAGAAVVSGSRDGHRIKKVILKADSNGLQLAKRAVPGYKISTSVGNSPWIKLDGHAMFRFATGGFSSMIQEITAKSGWSPEDVTWVIPHQANRRILKAAAPKCGIPFERWYINIDRVGNTSSASIPLALLELEHDLHKGDKMVFCAVGAGITIAALTLEW